MNSVGSKVWDWHTAGEARTRASRAFPAGVVVFRSLGKEGKICGFLSGVKGREWECWFSFKCQPAATKSTGKRAAVEELSRAG